MRAEDGGISLRFQVCELKYGNAIIDKNKERFLQTGENALLNAS